MPPDSYKSVIVHVVGDIGRHRTMVFATALSYYFIMALFPGLITLAALVGYLPFPDIFGTVMSALRTGPLSRFLPPTAMGLVESVVTQIITPRHGALLSAGLVGTLWSASSGFATMIDALNVAYDAPKTRPLWKQYLIALLLTLGVGSMAVVGSAAMIVGPRFGDFLADELGVTRAFALLWPYLRYSVAFGFILLAVVALYLVAPEIKLGFRDAAPGAALAVAIWLLLSGGLSIYFTRFARLNRTYGTLGGGVALLMWMEWTMFAVLVGAELNSRILQMRQAGKASSSGKAKAAAGN